MRYQPSRKANGFGWLLEYLRVIPVDFWEERYEAGSTPWDLGEASPHFKAWLKQPPDFIQPGKMAVLGAGRGHDAAIFARHGFEVIGFDYAPGAIEEANRLYGQLARFEQADIFELAAADSCWAGQFDYVLEHTCFCAILPNDRAAYVQSVQTLLKPGGYLLGVFWQHNDSTGPPFTTTEADIHNAFANNFEIVSIQEKVPVSNRSGLERLILLRRKNEL